MAQRSGRLTRREMLQLFASAAAGLAIGPRRSASAAPPEQTKAVKMAPERIERAIPRSGEKLPVIGLGTWQTFDVGTGDEEREPLRQVLHLFVERGGRVIDSSPMYGRAEGVVGDLRRGLEGGGDAPRSGALPLFLATKVWTSGRDAGIQQMQRSLARLRTERLDLMQIHNLVDWRTHLRTLRQWKERGTFRYIGVTHYQTSAFGELAVLLRDEPIDFVQLPYSVATRAAEESLLPLAAERQVAVLVNRPFEEGALFRQVRGKSLPEWAGEIDCTSWGQLLLKYIVAHPAVTCVIPATNKPAHLVDNLQAGSGRLPDAELRRRIVAAVLGPSAGPTR